ncbi:peptidase domain-containing ABC transporter [Prochlorococcus sp. MIT 0916]
MLSNQLNIPFRGDTVEKILLDAIEREKKISLRLMAALTSQVLGLHAYLAKVLPKNADRLPVPSIIPWKNNFALVRESCSNYLEIVTPTEGVLRFNSKQFEEIFQEGFIDVLKVEKSDTTPEKKFGIQWLLPAINRYRGVLIQVLLASFIVQLLGLASPLMIQIIIDKVISQRSLDTLQILGIGLVVITIFGGIISSLRIFLFQETTNRIDTKLGAEVIDHLLRLPLKFYDPRPVGELGSRVAELEKIRNFITGQALTTLLDASFSIIYIVVMVFYSWLLTLIALAVVPIQTVITLIGTPLIRGQIREVATENAKTQSHLVEVLTGIQTVKAQNVERISRWKWQELYSKYISKSFEKTITTTVLSETSKVLQQLSQILVLWIGASLVLKGELSLGQLIAFRIISGFVTQPLLRLSTIWQNIQELRVSFERLADIIDSPQETTEKDKSKIVLPSIKGDVEFDDVSFSFKQRIKVLKNINLKIQQGQFVGIVGQSGSGKSTLMKLLARLYSIDTGRIMLDGYDIDKVELYSLRRQIGIVPQEPLLFAGTVSDNIALTNPDTSSEEIVRVAKIANAHNFIMELSDGYSTKVGERGAGLSGGQKQRIAIARTLMTNPKLLIMDEATSALDYSTERTVCEGLRKSCTNSTVFFITHRLSTVRNADLIVMLDQGSIVETGTHEELMNKKERYFALYRQQESS